LRPQSRSHWGCGARGRGRRRRSRRARDGRGGHLPPRPFRQIELAFLLFAFG
jgi:hypothetical protein